MTLIEFLRLPLEVKVDGVWLSGVEGEYIEYRDNGNIRRYCFYKNEKLHGEYKSWHPDGQLWECCCYKNGKLHGECKAWHNDGLLYRHSLYRNGIEIKDYLNV